MGRPSNSIFFISCGLDENLAKNWLNGIHVNEKQMENIAPCKNVHTGLTEGH